MRTVLKRIFDLSLAIPMLLMLSPVLAVLAAGIWLFMGAPVIYRQLRPGLRGAPFKVYKFRTMKEGRDQTGNPLPDAERLTAFGRFLRSTSLDELPELFNVVKGEMSLVGPRPLLMEYLPLYSKDQRRRHDVLPGITGWAQVNGRNALNWDEKFKLDVWYAENASFWLDVKILFMTIIKVLKREGISQAGQATMEKFKGKGITHEQ